MKNKTRIKVESDYDREFRTGVSLHCHTKYSKEFLDFVPYYAKKYPGVSTIFDLACSRFAKANGRRPNFNLGHWEPPLEAVQLVESEATSLGALGLRPLISITDHDSIQAGIDLLSSGASDHPISMEWTVPFEEAYFHIGVHNLPPLNAEQISTTMLNYTFGTGLERTRLDEVMSMLNQNPDVLIVFNHPFWDIEMIGQERHDDALVGFVARYGQYLHAIELNGFRPWSENQLARGLAEEIGRPIVSGGDRHCLHSNTMINVTNAGSFSEFVAEIRQDKYSEVLIRPEYSQSLTLRQVRSISQIMGDLENHSELRRSWTQRVHFDWEDGAGLTTLCDRWNSHEPLQYKLAIKAFEVLGSRWLTRFWNTLDPATDVVSIRRELSELVLGESPTLTARTFFEAASDSHAY